MARNLPNATWERNKRAASPFLALSASKFPKGARTIAGEPIWIDVAKFKRSSGKIIGNEELIRDVERYVLQNPQFRHAGHKWISVQQSLEREVLLEGTVEAAAIKNATGMRVLRGVRVVGYVGIAVSVYDVGKAGVKSYESESARPLVAEGIRQVGGWGGAAAGAKLGSVVGGAVGIETGPGALLTAGVGAIIFSIAGYFGADWIADKLDPN